MNIGVLYFFSQKYKPFRPSILTIRDPRNIAIQRFPFTSIVIPSGNSSESKSLLSFIFKNVRLFAVGERREKNKSMNNVQKSKNFSKQN